MAKLVWDAIGDKRYENGVSHGVLYVANSSGAYPAGVAWNGLTSISESPEGAEANELWADNIKYAVLRSAETFKATVEAYTYPDEFMACDGTEAPITGLMLGQQKRKPFGMCYRTEIGDDADPNRGYKLHIIYNATASPSEKSYETINDSPDAITFSWEIDTTPLNVEGYKPVSTIVIDSTKIDAGALASIENALYGTAGSAPYLPLPAALMEMAGTTITYTYTAVSSPAATANPKLSGWYVANGTSPETYSLTDDTTPQDGTTYYTRVASSGT